MTLSAQQEAYRQCAPYLQTIGDGGGGGHEPFQRWNICMNYPYECVGDELCVFVRLTERSCLCWNECYQAGVDEARTSEWGGDVSRRVIFAVNKDEIAAITLPLCQYLLLHTSTARPFAI